VASSGIALSKPAWLLEADCYHPGIEKKAAERILQESKNGNLIIRDSGSFNIHSPFAVSIKAQRKFFHALISSRGLLQYKLNFTGYRDKNPLEVVLLGLVSDKVFNSPQELLVDLLKNPLLKGVPYKGQKPDSSFDAAKSPLVNHSAIKNEPLKRQFLDELETAMTIFNESKQANVTCEQLAAVISV
jgi:hypothetical protein